MTAHSVSSKSEDSTGLEADHVVALAREAFSACKEAMSIAKDAKLLGVHLDDSSCIRYGSLYLLECGMVLCTMLLCLMSYLKPLFLFQRFGWCSCAPTCKVYSSFGEAK